MEENLEDRSGQQGIFESQKHQFDNYYPPTENENEEEEEFDLNESSKYIDIFSI